MKKSNDNIRITWLSRWLEVYANGFQRWLPTPFSIAIILTAFAAISSYYIFEGDNKVVSIVKAWSDGLWDPALMRFGFQAMFMLVLGHVLALSRPVEMLLSRIVDFAMQRPQFAAAWVAVFALILGWINWGLGLVAGALLAKAVIDKSREINANIHPGLVGAAGYMGLLIWHSGLSGSAPLKVAESGHLSSIYPKGESWTIPISDSISISKTIFTSWNLTITATVIVAIVCLFMFLGTKVIAPLSKHQPEIKKINPPEQRILTDQSFAYRLDHGRGLAWGLGLVCLGTAIWLAIGDGYSAKDGLGFVTPDWINLLLLGLALTAHGSVSRLLGALDKAISGASGILLQFPIYFGIMGLVTGTGLAEILAGALVSMTNSHTLPLAIFSSSGILNIFIPSGGGQWAVQGPLVIEACHSIGVPLEKGIMAMAYGDQWTNMLQPFWALPLLGITGLKARDILPFTMAALFVSGIVFIIGLLIIT